MTLVAALACLFSLAPGLSAPQTPEDLWDRYRTLAATGTAHANPELEAFLKSLTPEQMLAAARHGCDEAEVIDDPYGRAAACASAIVAFLSNYFDNSPSEEEGARALLQIIANDAESPWLRYGVVACLSLSKGVEFGNTFRHFAIVQIEQVQALLSKIIADPAENHLLRAQAIQALSSMITDQARAVYNNDPNVRAENRRTGQVVHVGRMVRAGELQLAPETVNAMKPIEERLLDNARLLGQIAADQNEDEHVRKHARRALEGYRDQPLERSEEIDAIRAKVKD